MTVAGPQGYGPDEEILRQAREAAALTGAQIAYTNDPREAVQDADVVYTDVWASMGQEQEAEERRAKFAAYQVNAALVRWAICAGASAPNLSSNMAIPPGRNSQDSVSSVPSCRGAKVYPHRT